MVGNLTQAPMLRINRHPILIDNETQVVLDLNPGESLYQFLHRHIDNLDGQPLVVTVGGKVIDRYDWHTCMPTNGVGIEVRFTVQRTALLIVALVVLSVFTAGAAAGVAGAAGGFGAGFGAMLAGSMGTLAASAVVGAIQIVGAMLINKVLGPKPGSPGRIERDTAYGFNNARNQVRQYEPLGLLFGVYRVTPDVISIPYTYYQNNDQYMGMILSPGINVDRFDPLHVGDTPMSTYQGTRVMTSGFPNMPDDEIPLYSNVDTLGGGALTANYGSPGPWVSRVGPADVVAIQVDISYLMFDLTSKGKEKDNRETVVSEYRAVGTTAWQPLGSYPQVSRKQSEQRRSYRHTVPRGQYELRVRRLGQHTNGSGATADFNLAAMTFIQADDASYDGIPRIGVEMKATGQLNGAPDTVRAIMYARTMPYWTGTEWVDADTVNGGLSNPGAQALQYARGFYSEGGTLIAGMGLDDQLIDIESFKAFMVHCATNGFAYNQWVTDTRSHDEVVANILLAGMGRYSWSPGRFTAIWVAEGQAHSGVVTMANIKSGEFQIDYSLTQGADGIEYTYVDNETWESKTLRVHAPGVLVMENPARITGEGVGNETHAAIMARYHMAQNLYQFKDIVFGQTLEHMAYGELSVIRLSHDLTQWGHSGRLQSASNDEGVITIGLDEPVPERPGVAAYVGLRIPGEARYRVFPTTRLDEHTLRLDAAWPVGVPFPGSNASNPAHDTIWLYDFKETPGLRCRVIGISPSDDLQGASVSVVPEGDEFWHYVKTGDYFPAPSESLLRSQPVVSGLRVSEEWVNQGNTVYSMLHANWNVEGVARECSINVAGEDGIFEEVQRTSAQNLSWRVDRPGTYAVLVRPFDEKGVPGVAQTVAVVVYGANRPPANVDEFEVVEQAGGVRRYTWDFLPDTIQSPDMAGVEIRYLPNHVGSPVWEAMLTLGDTGFYTAPFEAVVPVAGNWTFAIRTVNTNGVLAETPRIIRVTLANNLGENIGAINARADAIIAQQIETQGLLDAEVFNRMQGDLNAVTQAGVDATAKANAARDAAIAYADGLNAGISDLLQADEWNDVDVYPAGDFVQHTGKLYRSLIDGNLDIEPGTDPLAWEMLGNYASVGEAVAVSLSMATQAVSDVAVESGRIDSLGVRMGSAEVGITSVNQARIDGDVALGLRVDTVTTTANNAQSTATTAMTVASDAATIANTASTTAGNAQSTATSALNTANGLASSIEQVRAGQNTKPNALKNPTFQYQQADWNKSGAGTVTFVNDVQGSYVRLIPTSGDKAELYQRVNLFANSHYSISGEVYVGSAAHTARMYLQFHDAAGTHLGNIEVSIPNPTSAVNEWQTVGGSGLSPAGATYAFAVVVAGTGGGATFFRRIKVEQGPVPTSYSEEVSLSTVTQELRASVTGGGNLVVDSEFRGWPDQGTWQLIWNSQNLGHSVELNVAGDSWRVPGTDALSWVSGPAGGITSTAYIVYGCRPIVCEGGKPYIASVYLAAHRCVAAVRIVFYDQANNTLSETHENPTMTIGSVQGGTTFDNFRRAYVAATAPTNAVKMRILLWSQYEPGTEAPYVWFFRPMLEQAAAAQTVPSPWSAGGKEMAATHTVTLDVNGNVSGTQSGNDGKRSWFRVAANIFQVISSAASGLEWRDGYLRAYSAGIQLILGINFGQSSNLCFWYGPNIGVGNANKSNATIWFDTVGNAYFGGALSAGVFKNAAQNTSFSPNASVEIGPFGTNGNAKVITFGVSFQNSGWEYNDPGSFSLGGNVTLERSLNGGATWQTVANVGVGGTQNSFYDGLSGRYQVEIEATGSATFTDTTPGLQQFMYRARITSASGWPTVINNDGGNTVSFGVQRTSVISIEQ